MPGQAGQPTTLFGRGGAEMREVRSDPEVLVHAVVDGINVFVRDVLLPRCPALKEILRDEDILRRKYEVAKTIAGWKAVSWIDDAAEPEKPKE
jgi:hypothetical protein